MTRNLLSRIGNSLQGMGSLLKRSPSASSGATASVDDGTSEKAASRERKLVRRMKADLYDMLQEHPSSRKTVRHLAVLERTLIRRGFDGVSQLPDKVLIRGLAELEFLVRDWSPVGLAALRSRLAVLVRNMALAANQPSAQAGSAGLNSLPDSIDMNDVTEVEHELFEELERSWTGQMPLSSPEPSPGAQSPSVAQPS